MTAKELKQACELYLKQFDQETYGDPRSNLKAIFSILKDLAEQVHELTVNKHGAK